ncbi:VOC family protein [Streptomyces sanyensis]
MTMTEATRHTPGAPCWVSLMVHDVEATQDFYAALFGWEFEPGPGQLGPYVRAVRDGREVAGIGRLPADRDLPVAWTPYLSTADAGATSEAVRSCGGTVGVGPLDAGAAGRLLIGADPSGAVFGAWQRAAHLGAAVHGGPGTAVWHELLTWDAGVAKFYEMVFGVEARATGPEGRDRVTLFADGRRVASVRTADRALLRTRGPSWMTWFEVEDAAGAARRAVELGGRMDTPPARGAGGVEATIADPEGAVLSVVQRRT